MSSPDELEALLQTLVGRQCWYAEFGQDGSLWLDFGDGQFLTGCSLWVAVDTPWEITDDEGSVVVNDDPRAEEVLDLIESKVAAVLLDPETFGLFLWFANGCSLYVVPSLDDGLRQGPGWQLTLSDNVIKVGPGTKWDASNED